jgi:hypothetical protein
MPMRSIAISVMLLVLGTAQLEAGGSVYSRYGIGDILSFNGTRSYGFGGASAALVGDGFINLMNPAGLARIHFTRFSGTFEYTRFQSKTDIGNASYALGAFQGAAFAIPVDTSDGIVISMEATPYSSVRYAVSRTESTALASSQQTYYGSGGLSTLALGSSLSILPNVHVGAKLIYYFGRIRQYASLDFTGSSFSDGQFDRIRYHSGYGLGLGVIGESIGDFLGVSALHDLNIGIAYRSGANLEIQEEVYLSVLDTTNKAQGTFELPSTFTIGGTYLFGDRYLLAADYSSQPWGSSNVFGSVPPEFRDATNVSAGLEILPERGGDTFLKRTAIRLGIYRTGSYIQLNNTAINETGFTTGLGIPIGPDVRLDLGLQLGIRGTTSSSLQKDTIVRLSLGISASEVWFTQFAEE